MALVRKGPVEGNPAVAHRGYIPGAWARTPGEGKACWVARGKACTQPGADKGSALEGREPLHRGWQQEAPQHRGLGLLGHRPGLLLGQPQGPQHRGSGQVVVVWPVEGPWQSCQLHGGLGQLGWGPCSYWTWLKSNLSSTHPFPSFVRTRSQKPEKDKN